MLAFGCRGIRGSRRVLAVFDRLSGADLDPILIEELHGVGVHRPYRMEMDVGGGDRVARRFGQNAGGGSRRVAVPAAEGVTGLQQGILRHCAIGILADAAAVEFNVRRLRAGGFAVAVVNDLELLIIRHVIAIRIHRPYRVQSHGVGRHGHRCGQYAVEAARGGFFRSCGDKRDLACAPAEECGVCLSKAAFCLYRNSRVARVILSAGGQAAAGAAVSVVGQCVFRVFQPLRVYGEVIVHQFALGLLGAARRGRPPAVEGEMIAHGKQVSSDRQARGLEELELLLIRGSVVGNIGKLRPRA